MEEKKKWKDFPKALKVFIIFGLVCFLIILIVLFSGGDNSSTTNTQSNQNTNNQQLNNSEYISLISPIFNSMKSVSESESGSLNAFNSGLIDINSFKKSIDNLWSESLQNTNKLKEINPPSTCKNAHFYLTEASAGQFLSLDELSLYTKDYSEAHLTKASSYLIQSADNMNKLATELETNCK